MERLAIQKGQAFILVFSVTDKLSYDRLVSYYNHITSVKTNSMPQTPVIIVGNKCDASERDVETSDGLRLSKQWKCPYIETSAKQNHNTRQLFEQLFQQEKRRKMTLDADQNAKKSKKSRSANLKRKCVMM